MRAETVVQNPANPDLFSRQRGQRRSGRHERGLALVRSDDREIAAPAKVKIEARAAEANPADHPFDNDKTPIAPRQLRDVVGGEHAIVGIAPDAKLFCARDRFQRQPPRFAAARLELRSDPREARREQRLGERTGFAGVLRRAQIGERPAPAVGRGGKNDQRRREAEGARGDKITRRRRQGPLQRQIEAGKARDALVGERDLAPVIDPDRLDGPARRAAGGVGERWGRREASTEAAGRAGAEGGRAGLDVCARPSLSC